MLMKSLPARLWSGHFFPDQSAVVLVVAVAAVHMGPVSDLHLPHAANDCPLPDMDS